MRAGSTAVIFACNAVDANTVSSAAAMRGAASAYTRFVDGAISIAYRLTGSCYGHWDGRPAVQRRQARPLRGRACRGFAGRSGAGLLPHLERLDDVADPQIVVAAEGQTTLEALADLGRIVLEASERRDRDVVRDHGTIAQQTCLRVATDDATPDDAAGDETDLRRAEQLTDLRGAELDLFVLGLEHALERRLDLFDGLVDDRVVPDLHAQPVGVLANLALGAHVEPDDDRVRRARQVDVVLRDATDAAVDDLQLDFVRDFDLHQRVFQRLDGTGHVALEDERKRCLVALLDAIEQVLEGDPAATVGDLCRPVACRALLGDLPRRPVLRNRQER